MANKCLKLSKNGEIITARNTTETIMQKILPNKT